MYQIRCPICKRRVCDIITETDKLVIIELKCPHCRHIVRIEWLLRTFVKKE